MRGPATSACVLCFLLWNVGMRIHMITVTESFSSKNGLTVRYCLVVMYHKPMVKHPY